MSLEFALKMFKNCKKDDFWRKKCCNLAIIYVCNIYTKSTFRDFSNILHKGSSDGSLDVLNMNLT